MAGCYMCAINVKAHDASVWSSWAAAAKRAQVGATTIHKLGRDELQNVLQRLPSKERYMTVCKLWRYLMPLLATTAQLNRQPRLHATHAPRITNDRNAVAALLRCTHLRALVADIQHVPWWYAQHRDHHIAPRLERLALTTASFQMLPGSQISPVLAACTSLRVLTLELTQFNVSAAVSIVSQCESLEELGLSRVASDATDMSRDLDISVLVDCKKLTRLCIAALGPQDFASRASAFRLHGEHALHVARQCRKLTHVELSVMWNCLPSASALGPETYDNVSPLKSVSLHVWTPVFVALLPENDDLYNFDALLRVLHTLPALEHLRVSSRSDNPWHFTSYGCRTNADGFHVRDVCRAHGAFVRPNFLQQLCEIPAWPTLRSLHINVPVHPRGTPNTPLPPLSDNLTSLSLDMHGALPPSIADNLRTLQLPLLERLTLATYSWPTGTHDVSPALEWCARDPCARALAFNARIGAKALSELASLLPTLAALTRLEINVSSADLSAAAVAAALPRCRSLCALRLTGLSRTAAAVILPVLPAGPRLATLDLSGNDRHVLTHLAAALPAWPQLTRLVLRDIRADAGSKGRVGFTGGGEGVCAWAALARALPHADSLRTLEIGTLMHPPAVVPDRQVARALGLHLGINCSQGNLPRMYAALHAGILQCRGLQSVELDGGPSWVVHNFVCYCTTWQYWAVVVGGALVLGAAAYLGDGATSPVFLAFLAVWAIVFIPIACFLLMYLGFTLMVMGLCLPLNAALVWYYCTKSPRASQQLRRLQHCLAAPGQCLGWQRA